MTISEKIAGLPVAVNIAEPFQAQLTQAKPENGRTSGVDRPHRAIDTIDRNVFFSDKILICRRQLRLFKSGCSQ